MQKKKVDNLFDDMTYELFDALPLNEKETKETR